MIIQLDEAKRRLDVSAKDIEDLAAALHIDEIRASIEELEKKTQEESFWADQENSGKILQKLKMLKNKVEAYEALVSKYEDTLVLIDLANEANDESLVDEIMSEVSEIEKTESKMRIEVLLSGEYDQNNAIVSFHPGAGGTEAQDWALMLYRMYTRWAEQHNYNVKLIDWLDGEEAGLKSATIMVEGMNAYGYLKGENGVHRLVRVSPFDSSGRRHTSFASVEVIPEFTEGANVEIREEDLEITTHKSSGAGGQHVNKTESAIRMIHKPTGIVIECQDERSQFKNRDKAMKLLRAKLFDMKTREQNEKIASERRSQVGTGDRSERIRTYNYPQGRITDHRIGFTVYSLENFLNGNIEGMIDALATADTAEKLKNSGADQA